MKHDPVLSNMLCILVVNISFIIDRLLIQLDCMKIKKLIDLISLQSKTKLFE